MLNDHLNFYVGLLTSCSISLAINEEKSLGAQGKRVIKLHKLGCMFNNYQIKSSILQVNKFCDKIDEDKAALHNTEAPNPQNVYCNGQSAWEVMRQHRDFSQRNHL